MDLLEAYLREPTNEKAVIIPQKDPCLRAYGLSMFVDGYDVMEAQDEMLSFEEADAKLAQIHKFLHQDLLRAGDLGSTRQIGQISESKQRSGLAVCVPGNSEHRAQSAE